MSEWPNELPDPETETADDAVGEADPEPDPEPDLDSVLPPAAEVVDSGTGSVIPEEGSQATTEVEADPEPDNVKVVGAVEHRMLRGQRVHGTHHRHHVSRKQ